MGKNKDKVVSLIRESRDYDKFKVIEENRGQKESHGLKSSKAKQIQRMMDAGDYVDEIGLVRVNEDFNIIEGRHNFEQRKLNKLPIRYYIVKDKRYNDVPKLEMLNNVLKINRLNPVWTGKDMFGAALAAKAPLAKLLNELVEKHKNKFRWTDVLAILMRDSDLFSGNPKKADIMTFTNKKYIEALDTSEFRGEFKWFLELNEKARVGARKGVILKSAYDILWHAHSLLGSKAGKFRDSLLSIPDGSLETAKMYKQKTCIDYMVDHYNRTEGGKLEKSAVQLEVFNKSRNQRSEQRSKILKISNKHIGKELAAKLRKQDLSRESNFKGKSVTLSRAAA